MSADPASRRLAGNALWNLLPFGLGFLLNLVALRLVVDRIGVANFGLFGILTAVLAPFTLANLGFGEATIKYVAAAAARGDLITAGRYVRTTLAMNLLVGVLGGVILGWLAPGPVLRLFHLPVDDLPRVTAVLRWVGLGWFANQAAAVFLGVPPAFQRFRLVALGHAFGQTALFTCGVVGAFLGGLEGYAAGTAAGAAVGALGWWLIARVLLPGIPLRPAIDPATWRRSFEFGSWHALAQLGAVLANQGERVLLGIFLSPAAVGFYNLAQTFEQRIYSVVYKMAEVLFPHFSAGEDDAAPRKADQLLRATWILTALAVVALAPLVPLAAPILSTWISAEAAIAAAPVMQLLALAGILGCATNATVFFLLGNGATRSLAAMSAVTGGVVVGAAWFILPRYGLPAAGAGQVIAMLAQQAVLAGILLPRVLGSALRWSRLLVTLYAPILVGLAVAAGAEWLGFGTVRGWPAILAVYALLGAVAGAAVTITGTVLPGRTQRLADLKGMLVPVTRLVRRGT